MLALNIKLHSIILSKEIISPNDTIWVSITTYPDMQKQEKSIEVKEMKLEKISFKINFIGITEKITILFQKQSILGKSKTIASAVLEKENIKIYNNMINYENQKIDLFESIKQYDNKINEKSNKNPRIVGKMEIDFSLIEEFSKENYKISNEIFQKFSQINPMLITEGGNQNLPISVFNIE